MSRILVGLLTLMTCPAVIAAGARELVRDGNDLFAQGDYKGALERYADAEVDLPESPRLALNAGAALYRQDKLEEAFARFQQAAESGDADVAALAYYNLGNCSFKMGKLHDALQFYKKAIQLDTSDVDAKFNYELTRKMLQQQHERKKETPEQDKEQTSEGNEEEPQSGPSTPSPGEEKPEPEGEEGRQQVPSPTPAPSPSAAADASPTPGELTDEQLRQLLDYLAGKEAAAPLPPRQLRDYSEPEKNW